MLISMQSRSDFEAWVWMRPDCYLIELKKLGVFIGSYRRDLADLELALEPFNYRG